MKLLVALLCVLFVIQSIATVTCSSCGAQGTSCSGEKMMDAERKALYGASKSIISQELDFRKTNTTVVFQLDAQPRAFGVYQAKMYPHNPTSGSIVHLFLAIKVRENITDCQTINFENSVKLSNGQRINELPAYMKNIPLCSLFQYQLLNPKIGELPLSCLGSIVARETPYTFHVPIQLPESIPEQIYTLDTYARSAQGQVLFHLSGRFLVSSA